MCIGPVPKYTHSLIIFWSNVICTINVCWFKWPIVHEITSSRWLLIYDQLYLSINLAIICPDDARACCPVPGYGRLACWGSLFPHFPISDPAHEGVPAPHVSLHRVSQPPPDPRYWHRPRPLSQDIGRDQGYIISNVQLCTALCNACNASRPVCPGVRAQRTNSPAAVREKFCLCQ